MTNYFEFKENNETTFIANSGEDFIKIFINFDDNFCNNCWLLDQLMKQNIETWLLNKREIELYNLVLHVRKIIENNYNLSTQGKINIINKFKNRLKARKYFQVIDIEKAIEIKLKEYETLRAEILFHMQNRTQIILLGLTGIFAIAGLALTPLTDFFIAEDITLPVTATKHKITIEKIIDDVKQEKITIPLAKNKEDGITINRAIDGSTINNKAIIPNVFILSFIIPIASLYIIVRISDSTKTIAIISHYLIENIEKKVSKLLKKKLEANLYYSKEILDDALFVSADQKNGNSLIEKDFLCWERFIEPNRKQLGDYRIIWLVKILFSILFALSLGGSFILLSYDFDCQKLDVEINFENFEFFNEDYFIEIWMGWVIILCLIILTLAIRKNLNHDLNNDFFHDLNNRFYDKLNKNTRHSSSRQTTSHQSYFPTAARVCLCLIFLNAGFTHIVDFNNTVTMMSNEDLPIASVLLIFAIIFQLLGGLSLLLGYEVEIGSKLLILFLIPTTLVFNNPIAEFSEMNNFLKNIGLIGGLVMLINTGAGALSIDSWLINRNP